jgi:hypothetical protein
MSNIVLQPNASGTGNITIATPNTNTDRTLNIPDVAGDIVTTGDTGSVTAGMLNNTLNLSGKTVSNFTNPNGWNLLDTHEDSSTVNYANSVEIFDWSSHLNTYNVFHIELYYYAVASSGAQHFYQQFQDSAGSVVGLRYATQGFSQDNSTATPSYGTGTYWRTGFGVQNSTSYSHNLTIVNGRLNDTSLDVTMRLQSCWYREGSGSTFADASCMVDNSTEVSKYFINMDQASANGGESGRVYARLWGVY